MTTPPDLDTIITELRTWAKGDYGTEAAVELLAAHGSWLARPDFVDRCVHPTDTRLVDAGLPAAWLDVDEAAVIANGGPASLPASTSELQVLALAASLADGRIDRTLHDLVTGLDDRNVALVLDAIAHAATGHRREVTP